MNIKIDFYIVIRGEFFGAAFKVRQNINCGDIFEELAREYEQQYDRLNAKMDALKPLLCVYRGQDLYLLRKRIRIYYDMACECKRTASLLNGYYEEDLYD